MIREKNQILVLVYPVIYIWRQPFYHLGYAENLCSAHLWSLFWVTMYFGSLKRLIFMFILK